uniref:AlNc14C37G3233 protein n=1 Tax=Albugo laibachii Nc14 TaxID=890382 RepID=F0W8V8_9STRA|nr:AlNc14C37G3233 [Albugo laibachii Nc14]|eukprot:CCA17569.1 AlNc14C37G3233 [Albugo laibachii Nc14]
MLEVEELILRNRRKHLQEMIVGLLVYGRCPRRANIFMQDAQIVDVLERCNHMDARSVHVLEVSTRAWVGCLVPIDCVLCRERTISFYLNVERRRALGEDLHSVKTAGEAFANKVFFSVVGQLTPLGHLAGAIGPL